MKKNKKLILFDIDGTLIRTSGKSVATWQKRVSDVFKEVFAKDLDPNFDIAKVNGKVERLYFREIAESLGIPKKEFDQKFAEASQVFHAKLVEMINQGSVGYEKISDAHILVQRLHNTPHRHVALVTGNIERNAWLKLKASDFVEPFETGGFGDEFEDRGDLVLHAIEKASAHFGYSFQVSETVVIGDTVHDIAAAKKVGARSIAVSTGFTDTYEILATTGADVVTRSLLDERVLSLLGLGE